MNFKDGQYNYYFTFHSYHTIHVEKISEIFYSHHYVWFNNGGECDWRNSYGKDIMSNAAKKFGLKLIKLKAFL